MEEMYASLRELDDVKQDVRDLRSSMQTMDATGTRGVVGLQQSMTDLIRDLTELKVAFNNWTSGHEHRHEKEHDDRMKQQKEEHEDRVSSRRWLIGISIAALTALGGMYGYLTWIAHYLHK